MLAIDAVLLTIVENLPRLEKAVRLYTRIELLVRDLTGGPTMKTLREFLCWLGWHDLTSKIEERGRPVSISSLSEDELSNLTRRYCRHCGWSPDERSELLKGDKIV